MSVSEKIPPLGGGGIHHVLSQDILFHLHCKGFYLLNHISLGYPSPMTHQRWISAGQLGLYGAMAAEWYAYVKGLQKGAISLSSLPDSLCWSYDVVSGMISAKKAYAHLVENCSVKHKWWYQMWYWKAPPRVIVCCCLALEIRLSWDNLNRRGMMGPRICLLCGSENESILHLFVSCSFCQSVWQVIGLVFNVVSPWSSDSLSSCFLSWHKNYPAWGTLPCYILWELWRNRNLFFKEKGHALRLLHPEL